MFTTFRPLVIRTTQYKILDFQFKYEYVVIRMDVLRHIGTYNQTIGATMSQVITEQKFTEIMQEKLGSSFDRALTLFKDCGAHISWDVINVLMHAADKGKIDEVLSLLEEHYQEHLHFQHPDIRGQVSGTFGNPTQALFLRICSNVLGLEPNPT